LEELFKTVGAASGQGAIIKAFVEWQFEDINVKKAPH
jgi:hypothetical protein